jgi:hypothetical protein
MVKLKYVSSRVCFIKQSVNYVIPSVAVHFNNVVSGAAAKSNAVGSPSPSAGTPATPILVGQSRRSNGPRQDYSVNRQQTRQLAAMLQERDDSVVTALSTQDLRAAFEFA